MRAQVLRSFWGVTALVLVGVTSGTAASPVPFQVDLGASRIYIKVEPPGDSDTTTACKSNWRREKLTWGEPGS
jgi:hypothetical protein